MVEVVVAAKLQQHKMHSMQTIDVLNDTHVAQTAQSCWPEGLALLLSRGVNL
jgi:hypothetical protein